MILFVTLLISRMTFIFQNVDTFIPVQYLSLHTLLHFRTLRTLFLTNKFLNIFIKKPKHCCCFDLNLIYCCPTKEYRKTQSHDRTLTFSEFSETFLKAYNTSFPIKTKVVKTNIDKNKSPWIT